MSLLIVEQNVHTVLALAQRAYILEGGRIVGEGEAKNYSTTIISEPLISDRWHGERHRERE